MLVLNRNDNFFYTVNKILLLLKRDWAVGFLSKKQPNNENLLLIRRVILITFVIMYPEKDIRGEKF